MKKTSILLTLALSFLLIFTTSCFDSNSGGTSIDGGEFMTIVNNGLYVEDLLGDSGNRYSAINSEVLQLKNEAGETVIPERAIIYFSYVDEVQKTRKTTQIKIEQFQLIPVLDFNLKSDILNLDEGNFTPFADVVKPWGIHNYITVGVSFYYDNINAPVMKDFSLFIEEAKDNTLDLRLVDTRKEVNGSIGSNQLSLNLSYRVPREYLMTKYPDLDLSDSISVKIKTNKLGEGDKDLPEFKIKID